MLKITDTEVYGIERALRISHLPMDRDPENPREEPEEKALDRCWKLGTSPAGSGHDNFLHGILVYMTVTAPRFWWPEAQRYHWLNIDSSSSTMHTLLPVLREGGDLERRFDPDTPKELIACFCSMAERILGELDDRRITASEALHRIKCCLPEGWLLTAALDTNYQQLKTIWNQRRTHRLPEWGEDFCDWIGKLPHSEWITGLPGGEPEGDPDQAAGK